VLLQTREEEYGHDKDAGDKNFVIYYIAQRLYSIVCAIASGI
jgi:hypothetical protein